MPNWYRWLLIASATLIMCACQAPLMLRQQADLPFLASPLVSTRARARRTDNNSAYSFSSPRIGNSRAANSLLKLRKSLAPTGGVSKSAGTHRFAPVIRRPDSTVQLQEIESILTKKFNASAFQKTTWLNVRADDGNHSPVDVERAVHLPFNNSSDSTLVVQSQFEENVVEDIESPFADDLGSTPKDPPTHSDVQGTAAPGDGVVNSSSAPTEVPPSRLIAPELSTPAVLGSPHFVAGTPHSMAASTGAPWRAFPDEYICDGGDAGAEVQVLNDWSLRNLDPEDTVGHYDTVDGRLQVQPSNRVYIYAPRFAATRQVTGPYQHEEHLQAVLAIAPTVAVTDRFQQGSHYLSQNLAAQRHLSVQPASEFRERVPGAEASQNQQLFVFNGDFSVYEDFTVIRTGVHKLAEKARLTEFTEAAISWSHDAAVQVVLDQVIARTRDTVAGVEEFFSVESKGSPKLRVIKAASVSDALPGEEVEFTLRFDNVGYQVIGNVTIIDNLTTRLEYIQNTAECSIQAEFNSEDNQAQSLSLHWEIAKPLKPGDGGIIRFKCRVR